MFWKPKDGLLQNAVRHASHRAAKDGLTTKEVIGTYRCLVIYLKVYT